MKLLAIFLAAIAMLSPVRATAQWWDNPGMARGQAMYVYKRADIDHASGRIQRAVLNGEIDVLESMHEEFLRLEKAGGPGRWMMTAFARAIEIGMPVALGDRDKLFAMLARWKQERPQSLLRPMVEVGAWYSSAWAHRGSGVARDVSPEALTLFRRDLDRAAAALEGAGPGAAQTPLYYMFAILIAGSSGRGAQVMDAAYREGAAKYPLNFPIVNARRNFMLPQWGGSHEALDRLIRDAVARSQHAEGTAMYAALYTATARNVEQRDFFGRTKADWRLMRHSFEDSLALEDDFVTLNAYATFACMAGDRETLRRTVARLGRRASLGLGLEFVSPDACLEMARGDR